MEKRISDERITALVDALQQDETFTKELVKMSPEEAAAALRVRNYDFTTDDLVSFYDEIMKYMGQMNGGGELDEELLENVSGGCMRCFGQGVVIGVLVVAGAVTGAW